MTIRRLRHQSARKRRSYVAAAVLAVVALAAGTIVALLPGHRADHPAAITVADVSGRPTACLAADARSAAGTAFNQVWAAMHAGQAGREVNVQQLVLPITSAARAQPYLAGLANQHCDLIVTVGPVFGQAITAQLKLYPQIHFTAVAPDTTGLPAQVTVLTPAQVPSAVQHQVHILQPAPHPTAPASPTATAKP